MIYIGTSSRTIFTALRMSYLIAALVEAKWLCDRHTANPEQDTLAEFVAKGAYERPLRRARKINAKEAAGDGGGMDKHVGERAFVTGAGSGTILYFGALI